MKTTILNLNKVIKIVANSDERECTRFEWVPPRKRRFRKSFTVGYWMDKHGFVSELCSTAQDPYGRIDIRVDDILKRVFYLRNITFYLEGEDRIVEYYHTEGFFNSELNEFTQTLTSNKVPIIILKEDGKKD